MKAGRRAALTDALDMPDTTNTRSARQKRRASFGWEKTDEHSASQNRQGVRQDKTDGHSASLQNREPSGKTELTGIRSDRRNRRVLTCPRFNFPRPYGILPLSWAALTTPERTLKGNNTPGDGQPQPTPSATGGFRSSSPMQKNTYTAHKQHIYSAFNEKIMALQPLDLDKVAVERSILLKSQSYYR